MEKVQFFVNFVLFCVVVVNFMTFGNAVNRTYWAYRNPTCNGWQNASHCEITNVDIRCGDNENPNCPQFYYNGNETIYPASGIKVLIFRYTSMDLLPQNLFETLSGLERLDCDNCHLKKFTYSRAVKNILQMNFNNNEIEEIDAKEFSNYEFMYGLNLTNNSLRSFDVPKTDNSMFYVFNYVIVSHNAITQARLKFVAKILDFSYNQITEFTISGNLQKISELRLGHNKLQNFQFVKNMNNMKYLDLSHNDLGANFNSSDLAGLVNLEHLDLQNVNLPPIDNRTFSHQTKLRTLDISQNNWKVIDFNNFPSLKELRILSIDDSELTHTQNIRAILPKLEMIDIWVTRFNCELMRELARELKVQNIFIRLISRMYTPGVHECLDETSTASRIQTTPQSIVDFLNVTQFNEVNCQQLQSKLEITYNLLEQKLDDQSKIISEMRASNKLLERKLDALQFATQRNHQNISGDLSPLRNMATVDGHGLNISNNITFNLF